MPVWCGFLRVPKIYSPTKRHRVPGAGAPAAASMTAPAVSAEHALLRAIGTDPTRPNAPTLPLDLPAARRLLEGSDRPLKAVAFDCGFGSADRMRIVFTERLGVSPAQYRSSFRKL